jgi:anti-repressor protein
MSAASSGVAAMNEIVPQFIEDGTVYEKSAGTGFSDSRRVAELTRKPHKDILRSIDNLLEQGAPSRNFAQGYYELESTGSQQHRMYEISEDGIALLVFGMTGADAMEWKLKYISAFNYLRNRVRELETKQSQFVIPATMGDALRLAAEQYDRAEKAEQKVTNLQIANSVMKPDAEAYARLASTPGAFKGNIVAKVLKMPVKEFYRWLREDVKWVFYQTHHGQSRLIPYAQYEKKGYATVDLAKAKIRGEDVAIPALRITSLGIAILGKKRNISDAELMESLKSAMSTQGELEFHDGETANVTTGNRR